MDHPSPYLPNPEALSPVWSWYVGHRARSMYTPALGWIKYPVLPIKEKTTSASLHILSGGGSSNISENCSMSTSVSYFFVGPYPGHFPIICFHHARHLVPWLLFCCTSISPYGKAFSPSLFNIAFLLVAFY